MEWIYTKIIIGISLSILLNEMLQNTKYDHRNTKYEHKAII